MSNYTRDHMETACCLWESMLEQRTKLPALDRVWLRYGTSEMRLAAIDMAKAVDEEWRELGQDAQEDFGAFDWEFCPMIINRIDWTQWPVTIVK